MKAGTKQINIALPEAEFDEFEREATEPPFLSNKGSLGSSGEKEIIRRLNHPC